MPDSTPNSLRSLLFVPGDQPRRIDKAWHCGADCVVVDLEDGVARRQKAIARETLAGKLSSLPTEMPHVVVRINGCSSEWAKDLDAVIHPGVFGVMVPKCKSVAELVDLDRAVQSAEEQRRMGGRPIRLFLLIESARGLLDLPSLIAASDRTSAIVLGAEDLCLDMSIPRTRGSAELGFARWQVALCARANGLAAIDAVFTDFEDSEGLWQDTRTARNMGFTGKLAIHPRQIVPIHSAFVPDEAEVAEARATLEAYERAEAFGQGAIAFEGKMVDGPIVQRAREIVRRAQTKHDLPA